MSLLQLDANTDRRLADLAALTGETPAEIARRAIAAYAAEIEATRAATEAKAWLAQLRRTAVIGDVLGPSSEDWHADYDRL